MSESVIAWIWQFFDQNIEHPIFVNYSMSTKTQATHSRFSPLSIVAMLLLILGAIMALNLYQEWQRTLKREQDKLITQARVIQMNVAHNLQSVDAVLVALSNDSSTRKADSELNQHLKLIGEAMPSMRTLLVVDAEGVIRASNRSEVIGKDVSHRDYFQAPKNHPQADTLYISPPFRTVLGTFTINVTRTMTGPDGKFMGVVSAGLDPAYFSTLLESVRYAPDMWVAIAHDTGDVFMMLPEQEGSLGKKLAQPETFLTQHQASHKTISTHHGLSFITNQPQILIWATVKANNIKQDHPLLIAVARDDFEVFAVWRRDALIQGGLYAILVVSLLVGFVKLNRSQRKFDLKEEASAQSLREKVQELDMILDNSSVGIIFLKGRRLLWLNKQMLEMFGYTMEELLNQTTAMLYASQEAYEDFGHRAYAEITAGRRFAAELPMRRHDGTPIWMRISGQSTPNDYSAGDSIWVFEDISERKKQETELEGYRANLEELVKERTKALMQTEARASHILDSSADGLYGTDTQGRITFINAAACEMLGYSPEQVTGQDAHPLFHHSYPDGRPYPAMLCPNLVALQQGEVIRVDSEVFWHVDGHALPVMYSVHPMRHEGKIIGAVTSFVDVSVERAASEARKQALLAAESLARMRSEFLSNVSHELRTPLNGILGFASIGYRNYQNPDKAYNAFAKIQESGNRLFEVVNDVLDFSDIDSGQLTITYTRISLSELLEQVVEVVHDRALAKHLDLLLNLSPTLPNECMGDPLRIKQVLLKLLSNAVKFTEAGSVSLSIALIGDQLQFRVTDTGIGISSSELEGLFNPFHQIDGSASRKFGGTGLGLAISQRLVELMGGDIRLESHPGIGTTVEFELPYLEADPDISAQPHFASTITDDLKA